MSRLSHRLLSRHFSLLALVLALVCAGVGIGGLQSATAAPLDSAGPHMDIVSITPDILTDQSTVTIRVRLSGVSTDPNDTLRLSTLVHADPFLTSTEVDNFLLYGRSDSWVTDEVTLNSSTIAAASTDGGTVIEISIPTSSLPFWNPAAWGPYGLTVRLLGSPTGDEGGEMAQARSLLLWYPPESSGTSEVNLLVTEVTQEVTSPQWADFMRTGVTMALTPHDLDVFRHFSPGIRGEVVVLPQENASLSLLATVGQEPLYSLAEASRQQASSAEDDDLVLLTDVILADPGWMGLSVIQKAAGQPVLTPPAGLREPFSADVTATSKVMINRATGETVINGEGTPTFPSQIGIVLDSWAVGSAALSAPPTPSIGSGEAFTEKQRIRALTAMATQEDPEDVLRLWINVPAASLGPDPSERLSALLDVPWITPVSLQDIVDAPPSNLPRLPVRDHTGPRTRTVTDQLSPLAAAFTQAMAVMTAAADAGDFNEENLQPVLAATVADLSPTDREAQVEAGVNYLASLTDVVSIIPSSTVNVMGRNVPFPVTIANQGEMALSLLVGLEVSDSRLSADEWVETTVPAGGSVTVRIPVQAVGAGEVGVLAVATTHSGVTLDISPEIKVRVRADWEDTGTWVVGGLLVVLFIAGLARTIRRGRRPAVTDDRGE